MLKGWRAFFGHRKRDERGAEFAAALFVFPVLFILIIGCIEIGFYVQTRMRVENILRDSARSVAAEGGDNNPRTRPVGIATPISAAANRALWTTTSGCKVSRCDSTKPRPTVNCTVITRASGGTYDAVIVEYAGETVTCKIVGTYPYKPLAATLMEGTMGLGIGQILADFPASESARSETGTMG